MYRDINKELNHVILLSETSNRKKLFDYLFEIGSKKVKIIQTIMYVGRDMQSNDLQTQDEIFNEVFDDLTWNEDLGVEIHQMIDKAPFIDYLKKGIKLLGIVLKN